MQMCSPPRKGSFSRSCFSLLGTGPGKIKIWTVFEAEYIEVIPFFGVGFPFQFHISDLGTAETLAREILVIFCLI